MLWLMTMGRRLNGVYAAFMLVAFMMGVAGALQAPTLSLFLSREVGAQPFWVGLFYTVNAIAGILVSLWLAKRSDSQGDRRKLILFCCAMAVGNALLFAFNRHYLTLITCGVLLASLANTAMPQLFALAREYADSSAREVVMFSSVMRAQLSLAWVIGPPLAFMLALNYGFTTMFSIAAGIFVISLALIAFALPSVARVEQVTDKPITQVSGWQDKKRSHVVYRLHADVDLQHHVYHRYAAVDQQRSGTARQARGDPDGHRCRAGDPGDDSGGLLRKTFSESVG